MALSKRGDSKHIERCFLNAIGCLHDRGLGRLNEHLVTIRVKCAELMWNTKTNEGQIDAIFLLRRLQKALETWYGEDETTVYKSQLRVAFGLGKLLARGGERQEGEGLMTDVAEEILKERMRREEVEVDIAEEGEWFDDKETLEVLGALGKHYVDTNQHKLAYPVYQQKLSLLPPSSLETVLASTFPHSLPSAALALVLTSNLSECLRLILRATGYTRYQGGRWSEVFGNCY